MYRNTRNSHLFFQKFWFYFWIKENYWSPNHLAYGMPIWHAFRGTWDRRLPTGRKRRRPSTIHASKGEGDDKAISFDLQVEGEDHVINPRNSYEIKSCLFVSLFTSCGPLWCYFAKVCWLRSSSCWVLLLYLEQPVMHGRIWHRHSPTSLTTDFITPFLTLKTFIKLTYFHKNTMWLKWIE